MRQRDDSGLKHLNVKTREMNQYLTFIVCLVPGCDTNKPMLLLSVLS